MKGNFAYGSPFQNLPHPRHCGCAFGHLRRRLGPLFPRTGDPIRPPNFAGGGRTSHPTDDGDDEKMPQAEGGGAVNITYSNEVTISLADATAAVQITNPTRSNQSMLIQLMIQDVKVGQSGTIPPGNQLTVIPLDENITLEPGTYEGMFHLLFFDVETNEQANLNTNIPVHIVVQS